MANMLHTNGTHTAVTQDGKHVTYKWYTYCCNTRWQTCYIQMVEIIIKISYLVKMLNLTTYDMCLNNGGKLVHDIQAAFLLIFDYLLM